MFVLEEPSSKKRPRSSTRCEDLESHQLTKKKKSASEDCSQPRRRTPSFWNTLSRVWLTRGSLKEFDRRHIQEAGQRCHIPIPYSNSPDGRARQRLKRFARRGGPDLSHLRGFAGLPLRTPGTMSGYGSSQSRKRSSASSKLTESTRTTPYSGHFEQKLIDSGIYPGLYEHPDGRLPQKPANLSDIQAAQRVPRASLSPSRFTDEDFEKFQRANVRASGEGGGLYNVLPFIAGTDIGQRFEMDLPLSNFKPFDENLSDPKPDVYHGAALSTIHPRVRADLGPYIIPSMADLTRPAAPNFFVEGKSPQGRADVARRQAMHDGAMGARAIHELQNYKAEEPQYDNKARSFSATYHAGTGTLQTYVHHLTAPLTSGGKPECHMTQSRSFAMTDTADRFREGATTYRNDRDRAKSERDSAITHANQVARQMPAPTSNTSFTTSRTSRSTVVAADSDTSEDELARDEVTPVKRPRPSAVSPISYGSATGRDDRNAFEAPTVISSASLPDSKTTMPKSRYRKQPSMEESITRQATIHTQKRPDRSSIERPSDRSRQSQSLRDSGRRR